MLLGISCVLAIALLPPVLARKGIVAARLSRLLDTLLRLLWGAVIAGLLTGVIWFLLQVAAMSGRTFADAVTTDILRLALWGTSFGQSMFVRLILALPLVACLAAIHRVRTLRARILLFRAISI